MFKSYFKTAWRNLRTGKMHSFINIAGLSTGMAVAILIGFWMYDELSFNKNFDNYDHIAQVYQNLNNNGETVTWTNVPYPLAEELRTNYGDNFKRVAMGVRSGDILSYKNKKLKEDGFYFEKEAPEMFSLQMLRGTKSLDDPSSILLSAQAARAYFGEEDPVNKLMKIGEQPPVKVTGVYKDFPRNSAFANINFISTWESFYNNNDIKSTEDPWRPNFTMLFVQLNDHADINQVAGRIKDAKLKKLNPQLQKKKPALFLQPMSKWHLYAEFKSGVNTGGAIQYVWMFGLTGVFVLLLACVNFMNLSTARSEKRAKEVGIRKTLGSIRKQLILQFFSESLLTVFFSFLFSILLVQLTLSFFNQLADKQMSVLWLNPLFWLISVGFILVTSLIAGSYPALYLSSFQPVKVLKGSFKAGRFAATPRKVLVVLQFTVSVTLIIGTVIVYRQIQFAKDRRVGYSRNNLISIPVSNASIHDHFNVVQSDLEQTGTIASIAESESPATGIWNTTSGFSWREKDPDLSIDFGVVSASYDYGKTIGWQLKEGRNFSRDYATDTSSVILNEAAVQFMNLKDPVGETVTWWGQQLTVIGVIDNMVIESPYDQAKPVIYSLSVNKGNIVLVKLKPNVSSANAIQKIQAVFKKFNAEEPFEYRFVDEDYAAKFDNEQRIGNLAAVFGILAIIISCLGLFGLTSFVAEQRKKEIGLRKVLGASVFDVWNLLSKEFVSLVIVSFFISIPLSYYFMHNWLQGYNYRTTLSSWIFIAAGSGALLITLITVSFQSIKAAIVNPVKSLRTE